MINHKVETVVAIIAYIIVIVSFIKGLFDISIFSTSLATFASMITLYNTDSETIEKSTVRLAAVIMIVIAFYSYICSFNDWKEILHSFVMSFLIFFPLYEWIMYVKNIEKR